MNAADIMTRHVLAIDPRTPLAQAVRLMTDHKISGLPVVDAAGQVVGMLTEGDLLRRVETGTQAEAANWLVRFFTPGRQAEQYIQSHGRTVGELMTGDVVAVAEDTPLPELVRLMQQRRVKRLPVLRDGKLVGVVSRADVVRKVGEALSAAPLPEGDSAIHAAILEEMTKQSWAPLNMVSIAVKDGVVSLDGCLSDLREREALSVIAENVPGVVRVDNRIICVEPQSGAVIYDPAADAPSA